MPRPHAQDRQSDNRGADCRRAQLDLWPGGLLGHLRTQHADVAGGAHSVSQAVDSPREVLTRPLDLRDQDIRVTLCNGALDGHCTVYFDRPAPLRHDTSSLLRHGRSDDAGGFNVLVSQAAARSARPAAYSARRAGADQR
jgi:hypothetical protein